MKTSRKGPGGRRILLAGATGVVGQAVLRLALADRRIDEVVALTRRPLAKAQGLRNVVADPAAVAEDADCWQVDAVVCTLGTTMAKAGSRKAFAAVDRDLVLRVARLARAGGATAFALNSSLGADSRSPSFYLRTKGEAEDGLRDIGYPGVVIVRPSLIDSDRPETRTGERIGILFARALRPVIPARYRSVGPEAIAQALLEGALTAAPGVRIIESEELA